MSGLINFSHYQMQYACLCFVSRHFWQTKRTQRVRQERRFVERILARRDGQVTAKDWARCMRSSQTINLLVGTLCPYRFAILGAVLIDKEISESTDFMKLSARIKGQTRDAKLLRILFESRMK